MPSTDLPVLLSSLIADHDQGIPHAGKVAERLEQWLEQLDFTVIGHDDEGQPITQPASACTPQQQIRASRFLEYELRDQLVAAKNSQTSNPTESKTSRLARLKGELDVLMLHLPQRMSDAQLEDIITRLANEVHAEFPYEPPRQLSGIMLKRLRDAHFGTYDGRQARDVVQHLAASLANA